MEKKYINGTYKRSNELIFVKDEASGGHIIYNRLLNSPILVDVTGYNYIFANECIDLHLESLSSEERDFFEMLISNFVYLPDGKREPDLIREGIKNHMEALQNGKYTCLLDLRMSSACNFGCKHCIASCAQNNELMTFDDAKRIIDEYYSFLKIHKGDEDVTLDVHIGIAEPLLAFDEIKKTIEYIDTKYSNVKRELSINTNLSLLTEEMAAFFRDHKVHVHVSIDGIGETNDLIRIYKDGSGTYNDIVEKIDLMKKVGYPIFDIGVTLTDNNYQRFKNESDEFIKWCKERGICEIACEFDLINSVSIPTQEKIDFLLDFVDRMGAEGIHFDGTWSIPYMNLVNASYANSGFGFCRGASGINMSVDRNGLVYVCSCSSKPICSIYNIDEELKRGGKFYSFVEKNLIGNHDECKDCQIEGCCLGQCRVTREYHDDFDNKIKEQCEFYKQMTARLLLREISSY